MKENADPTAKEDEESDLSDDPVLSALNKKLESVLESLNGDLVLQLLIKSLTPMVVSILSDRLLTLTAKRRGRSVKNGVASCNHTFEYSPQNCFHLAEL